jgi:hypothetical protein
MKFVTINPKARSIDTVEARELRDALVTAGLDPDKVDHGSLGRHAGYVVYEFGMFIPPARQSYFSIMNLLIAGNCVLYGVDPTGETIDLMKSQIPTPSWYLGVNDVEHAIIFGKVRRPEMRVNGAIVWQWPQPAPPGLAP